MLQLFPNPVVIDFYRQKRRPYNALLSRKPTLYKCNGTVTTLDCVRSVCVRVGMFKTEKVLSRFFLVLLPLITNDTCCVVVLRK